MIGTSLNTIWAAHYPFNTTILKKIPCPQGKEGRKLAVDVTFFHPGHFCWFRLPQNQLFSYCLPWMIALCIAKIASGFTGTGLMTWSSSISPTKCLTNGSTDVWSENGTSSGGTYPISKVETAMMVNASSVSPLTTPAN